MRVLAIALVTLGALGVGSSAAHAERPPCADSNGQRPGGMVYVRHGVRLSCELSPPQTLTVMGVPNRSTCDDMGGSYGFGSCWRIDY